MTSSAAKDGEFGGDVWHWHGENGIWNAEFFWARRAAERLELYIFDAELRVESESH